MQAPSKQIFQAGSASRPAALSQRWTLATLLSHFAVALGIGLLIGIERGWRTREEAAGSRTAGVRTFTIIGLLGGTIGVIAEAAGTPLNLAGGVILGLGFTAFCGHFRDDVPATKISRTKALFGDDGDCRHAHLCACRLCDGGRHASRWRRGAVATVCILALRTRLHDWLTRINENEIRSALILLAMTFIALPIVPDDPIGPFGG